MNKKKDYGYSAINISRETAEKFRELEKKTGLRREVLMCQIIALYDARLRETKNEH